MKKFRGQHRYYKRLKVGTPTVHRKMNEWIHYLINGQSQYDYDHIHFDCPKQPLFRWNAIKQHLDAMMCSFNVIAMKSKETPFEFQLWAFIGVQKDFGIEPALYFHTPNSEYEDFPQNFDDFTLGLPCGDKLLEHYLKQLVDKGFTILHSSQTDFIQIIIFKNNIGQNLRTNETDTSFTQRRS